MVYSKANSVKSTEMKAPAWLHKYIIGKKGVNIRNLTQDNPKVQFFHLHEYHGVFISCYIFAWSLSRYMWNSLMKETKSNWKVLQKKWMRLKISWLLWFKIWSSVLLLKSLKLILVFIVILLDGRVQMASPIMIVTVVFLLTLRYHGCLMVRNPFDWFLCSKRGNVLLPTLQRQPELPLSDPFCL